MLVSPYFENASECKCSMKVQYEYALAVKVFCKVD